MRTKLIKQENRKDGLKVCKEHKAKLKNFWGSHGDKKIYNISIIKES
ncbi:hypothetical protein G9F72_019855 [Clostridium estertheticum]|nr:hypothetical protein [Clostridium estertheticum]MBZ9688586.1 hypothetical protein [Clostridium estertheticum]